MVTYSPAVEQFLKVISKKRATTFANKKRITKKQTKIRINIKIDNFREKSIISIAIFRKKTI